MKIIKAKDYNDMSKIAAELVLNDIKESENMVLGLATGGTPEGMYDILVNKNKSISFKNITTFNLDEYIGLPSNHKLSYRYYMNHKLFNKIDINKENTFIPIPTKNIKKVCKDYEKLIKEKGGIDLQILGIGENAHIAFNEPGSDPKGLTSPVKLTVSTIEANSRYFNSVDEVPKEAISMGIGTILRAKKIILLASGKSKAKAIKATISEKVNIDVPSSYLQKHNDVTIIADKEALSLID